MTAYVPSASSKNLADYWRAIVGLAAGRSNGTGTLLLTAGATSTTVIDKNVATGAAILLSPVTANAAAALATTFIVSANGSFTATHANNAQTDRQFTYAIQG